MAADLPDLTNRSQYRHWAQDVIRFQDLDRVGHVNNIAFLIYAESGRVAWAEQTWPGSTAGTGIGWTIVRITFNYVAQAHYPGTVDIGTRTLRLGTSSCTVGQGLFVGDTCVGTAESVLVWTDVKAGRGLPIPPDMRAALVD
ncbi:MAG: thioesterase family protein [Rhodospirillaceae bacterium]